VRSFGEIVMSVSQTATEQHEAVVVVGRSWRWSRLTFSLIEIEIGGSERQIDWRVGRYVSRQGEKRSGKEREREREVKREAARIRSQILGPRLVRDSDMVVN